MMEYQENVKLEANWHYLEGGGVVVVVGLNIFYSKEKDWVWHKARHYALQGHGCFSSLSSSHSFITPLIKNAIYKP